MSKGKQTFRKTDVIRAIKAARDAGEGVRKVKITSESIELEVGPPAALPEARNEWDAEE
jgi:hypothetical protein